MYRFNQDDLFSRIGQDSMKIQALEGKVMVLETALKVSLGVLTLDESGISTELFAAASAEIERLRPTSSGDLQPFELEPEDSPPESSPQKQGSSES